MNLIKEDKSMLKDVYDVASFAEKFGYGYNQFIEMMEKDGILPFYERRTLEVYTGVGKSYGWSPELCAVFDAYVEEYGEQELTD